MSGPVYHNPEFDSYAADYDAALTKGIAVSGEDKNYFARGRVAWLVHCLRRRSVTVRSAMDFGCGIGSATPFLLELLGLEKVLGVDISAKSIEVAKHWHGSPRAEFAELNRYDPNGELDAAYCNGVFHHIPLSERPKAVEYVHRSLRPGGLFALWENNPWNPGARLVMSRIPFDRDAIMLSAIEACRLVRTGGFEVLRVDFLFIFPKSLRWLRWIEPRVTRLPLGAQYQVLCRKRQPAPTADPA